MEKRISDNKNHLDSITNNMNSYSDIVSEWMLKLKTESSLTSASLSSYDLDTKINDNDNDHLPSFSDRLGIGAKPEKGRMSNVSILNERKLISKLVPRKSASSSFNNFLDGNKGRINKKFKESIKDEFNKKINPISSDSKRHNSKNKKFKTDHDSDSDKEEKGRFSYIRP